MNYILSDEPGIKKRLQPFTFTRPVAEIRIGILTIREKWEIELSSKVSMRSEEYLHPKFPFIFSKTENNTWINGALLPSVSLTKAIQNLKLGEALISQNLLLAVNTGKENLEEFSLQNVATKYVTVNYTGTDPILIIDHLWDIFSKNDEALSQDYARLTKGKKSTVPSNTNTLIGKDIFIEEGVKMECAILNSTSGPIYIGKDVEIMEGAILKGSIALCEGATVKAGAKIYGPTTVGPHSKVGGEVSNAVIFGYSNKGHDGFLGNAVLGEWCNLGADTNNSNLKNNYSTVKIWSYADNKEISTGLTFCGLIMGDHSKCGINTMFNTGTVVGVAANIFGADFPKKFIPSFSWGGASGFTIHDLDKACDTAARMFERRHKTFDKTEKDIMANVFALTEQYRLAY